MSSESTPGDEIIVPETPDTDNDDKTLAVADDGSDVVDGELVEEVRALRQEVQEVRATFDHNIGSTLGLTTSQIEAIDNAGQDLRATLIDVYKRVVEAETNETVEMTALTKKDQADGFQIAKRGLWVLLAIVGALCALALIGVMNDMPSVAIAALSPIGLAAIGGVVTLALRDRNASPRG